MYLVTLGQGQRRKEREINQGDNFGCRYKHAIVSLSCIEEGTK